MKNNAQRSWHSEPVTEVEAALKTVTATGLSSETARSRLAETGSNVLIEEPPVSPLKVFLAQFHDFMIWVLLAALFVSGFILQATTDAIAIGAILVLNALLGFRQEYRAEKALTALKGIAAPEATVRREGAVQIIASSDLVPGDVILLQTGNLVPADGRLIAASALRVDQSMLTGESHAVSKDADTLSEIELPLGERRNLVFAGTSIKRGRAEAIVTVTGGATEMGKIAALIETREEPTPLQLELARVGKTIAIGSIFISIIVFVFGWLVRGFPLSELFLTAVSLAVAAIPEGLPAIVTVALALGVQEMARRRAIIRKLHAVETLGSTSFICTDKTGTLTENRMTLSKIYTEGGLTEVSRGPVTDKTVIRLLEAAVLNNDSHLGKDGALIGDPTETALIIAAEKAGIQAEELRRESPRRGEIPFDSIRKRMATANERAGGLKLILKGAPEEILSRCGRIRSGGAERELVDDDLERWRRLVADLADDGFRLLAFADRPLAELPTDIEPEKLETDLTFLGIGALYDAPRPEAAAAIAECAAAGIKVVMVTGDHERTAQAVAEEIGLDGRVSLTGAALESMSEKELAAVAENVTIYSRVAPSDKVKIVAALRSLGYTVAMTGDGVNDAPALKQADIGIAMGGVGTDVAREAADMVLADDNFATIVGAVREGRRISDNLRKTILFLISGNISEVLLLFLSVVFFGLPLPLLPTQILWSNLITDGLPALALGVDPPGKDLMLRPPRPREQTALSGRFPILIWQGLSIFAGSLAVFLTAIFLQEQSIDAARTMVFSTIVLAELLHSLNFRSETISVFNAETLRNRFLLMAIGGSILLQGLIIYLPWAQPVFHTTALTPIDLTIVAAGALATMLMIDGAKYRFRLTKAV